MADYALSYTGEQINEKLGQVPTSSSTTITGLGLTIYVYKYGNIGFVTLSTGTTNAASAQNGTIATLPVGYRPIAAVEVRNTFDDTLKRIQILPSGPIRNVQAMASGANPRFSAIYIIGG